MQRLREWECLIAVCDEHERVRSEWIEMRQRRARSTRQKTELKGKYTNDISASDRREGEETREVNLKGSDDAKISARAPSEHHINSVKSLECVEGEREVVVNIPAFGEEEMVFDPPLPHPLPFSNRWNLQLQDHRLG